jgi:outer membrane protein assembly factor BamB
MKNFTLIIFLFLFSLPAYSQNYQYGWLSDIHIGAPGADKDLEAVVDDINQRGEIKFVIATGDIAEKGSNEELETAKRILDKLNVSYYVIPGNHDTKWSESGLTKFEDLWGDNKFIFEHEGTIHIGLNSGIPWRGGGGHFQVEDIDWLKAALIDVDPDAEVYFYAHHPLDGDADNWFKVTNILRDYNISGMMIGHGHSNRQLNFNGINSAMGRSTLSRPKYPGYTLVENSSDSIKLFEIKVDSLRRFWGGWSKNERKEIPFIDSLQFEKYSEKIEIISSVDLHSTLSASLLFDNDRMYAASIGGDVTSFDLSGKIIWQHKTGGTIFSRPARDRDVLAVATIEGDLITLNANNGELIQIIGLGEALTSQLIIIDIVNAGVKGRGVVVGTAEGNLYCYDLYSFELVWQNSSAGLMIETKPLYIDNKIIFGSWDNYLYCIDASSGSLIWQWTENKNFYYSPAAIWPVTDGKNVYISTPDKFVSAIDLLLGTTVWRKEYQSWESIGISEDYEDILIKSFMNNFYIVSAIDGEKKNEIKIGYGLDTMPAEPIERDGKIIFGSKNGKVYKIDKEDNYNWEPLFFTGTARVHSVRHLKNNLFAASNMDGKIYLFRIN